MRNFMLPLAAAVAALSLTTWGFAQGRPASACRCWTGGRTTRASARRWWSKAGRAALCYEKCAF